MKTNIACILITILLFSGCSKFNKNHFFENSFGVNLNEYSTNKTTHYIDGLLEIYNVSKDDEIYKKFFANEEDYAQSENVTIESYTKTFTATEKSPIYYIILDDNTSDGFKKVILYMPEEKIIVFIYAITLI